jgi:hypothetical protein
MPRGPKKEPESMTAEKELRSLSSRHRFPASHQPAPKLLVVGIFTLAVAAVLLAVAVSVAPSKPANPLRPELWSLPPLPPEVKSTINDAIEGCNGEVKFEEGFVTRRDINGEGSAVILDYGNVVCPEYGDLDTAVVVAV